MDHRTMAGSIAAIAPWFERFFARGLALADMAPRPFMAGLRAEGIACERAMFAATRGVNTHKGGIFSMGLLCAASGRLRGRGARLEACAVSAEVARMTEGIVERELDAACASRTAGERFYRAHGLPGARGEAQGGFATARRYGIPAYREALSAGAGEERALLEALLALMAHNGDTNVVARGGIEGLAFVQAEARRLAAGPRVTTPERVDQLHRLDRAFVARNLSPGGSADLLAVSWFLVHLAGIADGYGS
jgi:triphosphoribosyl-dephospho-CoA synthase